MAIKMQFVPQHTPGQLVPLDEIPEDVKANVEEAWQSLSNSNGRIRATFESKDEADEWFRNAASYATQRPEAALKLRRSPTRDKADDGTMIDFTLKLDVEANGNRRGQNPSGSRRSN